MKILYQLTVPDKIDVNDQQMDNTHEIEAYTQIKQKVQPITDK